MLKEVQYHEYIGNTFSDFYEEIIDVINEKNKLLNNFIEIQTRMN